MSVAKPAVVTGAVIVALSAIPVSWQESKASKMRGEIAELDGRRSVAAATIEEFEATEGASAGQLTQSAAVNARTVHDLLVHAEAPVNLDDIMETMMETMMSQDIIGMIKLFMPFANMSREDYDRLLSELDDYEGNAMGKQVLTQMLGMFAPSDNPRESLERLIELDLEAYAYANLFGQWAADDNEGALAWYREKLESGLLDGKGINNSPGEVLLAEMLGNIAKKNSKRAIDLLMELADPTANGTSNTVSRIANSLGKIIKETGNDSDLLRLLEWDKDDRHSSSIVRGAMNGATKDGELPEVVAFVEKYLGEEDPHRYHLVSNHIINQRHEPIAERAEQLTDFLPDDERPKAIRQLVSNSFRNDSPEAAREWVGAQAGGPIQDQGWRALAEQTTYSNDYIGALADAQKIGDEKVRDQTMDFVGRHWLGNNDEAARAGLPDDVLERIDKAGTDLRVEGVNTTLEYQRVAD